MGILGVDARVQVVVHRHQSTGTVRMIEYHKHLRTVEWVVLTFVVESLRKIQVYTMTW